MIYRADNFCFFYFLHLKIGMETLVHVYRFFNKYLIKYCLDDRIAVREYELE